MTADPTTAAVHQLEAERLRHSPDERCGSTPWSKDLRRLIATLAGLLANPGPADTETEGDPR